MTTDKEKRKTKRFIFSLKMNLLLPRRQKKDKVLVVIGPTETGKSRLSIDLATRFRAEIINSDKMQVYKGLDIVTNKITEEEKRQKKDKVLVVIGPTGTGKSRLSIDLATRFRAEIIDSDKMQVYKGLYMVTNKITEEEK
ncbi:hypothetical protein QYF36_003824 [Acer negundo]|nr:hypothetical protein QYF36_003824 [Acer negundo]